MINPNWIRWVRASARKYFDDNKGDYFLFIEGDDRDQLKDKQVWAEFRINGPTVTPLQGEYRLDGIINIYIMVKQPPEDMDVAAKIAGWFQSKFGPIIIYKYGDGTDDSPDQDNPEAIGCFALAGEVLYTNFSKADNDVKIEEGAVAARYSMTL